ncbi:MAG TPA: hypothetical protein GX401_06385 [Clostridiales bacterium]|nr:hypothetical protein [Clostridiales bacterium]
MEKNKLLKVSGIMCIVFATISILALLGSIGLTSKLESMGVSEMTIMIVRLTAFFGVVISIFNLVAGIIGVAQRNLTLCVIFGGIMIALQVVNLIILISTGEFTARNMIGVVLPITYLLGAIVAKSENAY